MIRDGNRALVQYYRSGRVLRREYYEDAAMKRNLLWSGLTEEQKPTWAEIRGMVHALKSMRTCVGTDEQGSPNPCP
jgi:hypothetical protein